MKSGINVEKLKLFQLLKPINFFFTNANAQDFGQIQTIVTAQPFEKNTYKLYKAIGAIDINALG